MFAISLKFVETEVPTRGLAVVPLLGAVGLVDEVLQEPLGGAHRNPEEAAEVIRNALIKTLDELDAVPLDQLLEDRQKRLAGFGEFKEA